MFRNTPLILWIPLPFGPSPSSLYPFVFFALSHLVYSTALLSSPQFLSQTGLAVSIPSFPAHLFPATFTGFVQDEALSAFMNAARVPFFPRASLASIFTIDKAASLILRFPIRSEMAGFSAFPLDVLIHFLIFSPFIFLAFHCCYISYSFTDSSLQSPLKHWVVLVEKIKYPKSWSPGSRGQCLPFPSPHKEVAGSDEVSPPLQAEQTK